MKYLTEAQIADMGHAAMMAYEMTAERSAMYCAAREYAMDEFGVHPRPSAVKLAVKRASVQWMACSMATKKAVREG